MMNDLIFTIKMSVIMAAILAIIIFVPMATYEAGYWDGRLSVVREEAEADDDGQSPHDSENLRVHSEHRQTGDRVVIPYESNSYGEIEADGDLMFRPSTETLNLIDFEAPIVTSLAICGGSGEVLRITNTDVFEGGDAKLSHWLLTRADGTTESLKPPVRLDPVMDGKQ